jgi:ethanolaminephosphotransferase
MPRSSSSSSATTTTTTPRTVSHIESSSVNNDDNDVANNDYHQGRQQQQQHAAFFFLSESAIEKLPHFCYQGEDRSLLYYYILSPLASFCVEHLTPRCVAPNCITLFGLCLMISSYSVMWYHQVPTTLEQPPSLPTAQQQQHSWIFLWNALAILCYQTLDNMDGKQARRTGSSSPLGLLFDHGCDAINSLFGSVGWMISCGLNPFNDSFLCFTMLFGPYALFYIGTWEEYYTGKLIMPIMNGPNEGLLGAALVSLTAWWYGPGFWQEYTAWDEYLAAPLQLAQSAVLGDTDTTIRLRHVDLLVLASCIGYIQEISIKIWSVVRSTYYDKQQQQQQQQHHNKRNSSGSIVTIVVPNPQPCLDLLPFAIFVACFWIVGYIDLDIWLDMPRTSLHLSSVLFAEMTTDLMLAHVTGQAYNYATTMQQRWILLMPLILLTLAVVLGFCTTSMSSSSHRRTTSDFILVYTTIVTCYFATKAVMVINEMCTVLNIWCFDITTPRVRIQQQQQHAVRTLAGHENGHTKTE